MARLAFCDYHNMIAIMEKYEHNADFHQIVDFVEASHLRRNLKLRDEAGISSLPDVELFENLTLMRLLWVKAQELQLSPITHPLLRQYTKRARIAQSSALLTVANEPASPLGDDSQGEACLTVSGLEAEQDMANIIKTSALPSDSTPRVTSVAAEEGSDLEISTLKARINLLEDRDGGGDGPSREDATIKGKSLETGEEAGIERSTDKGSNDTKEMVNVLTSLDASSILTSGVQVSVPPTAEVPTVSIPPTGEIPTISVPTGSGVVPTASPIFTTANVATPYSRTKEEELKMLIDGLDRNNEIVTKYLQEYEQFTADLSIGERIELINDLVKYQDNYVKVLKYQTQQRKPLSKKQQKEFYMSVLRSHVGWKTKHFKGMSLEEIREKFVPVWKQIEDFIPIGSKEEGERFKRKGIREDLNQLWALVKETLSIRQATSNKEKELWVELKRLFEPDVKDQL
nr:hypothetical protein [Tanacetum cinerariifolium]